MAWDKKKYFRDRQAKIREKAKEYDKLIKEGFQPGDKGSVIAPEFGKQLAAERINELEKSRSGDSFQLSMGWVIAGLPTGQEQTRLFPIVSSC